MIHRRTQTSIILYIAGALLPVFWLLAAALLVASGIIDLLPAQDVNQMPPAVYQQHVESTQLSDNAARIWVVAGVPTFVTTVILFVVATYLLAKRSPNAPHHI